MVYIVCRIHKMNDKLNDVHQLDKELLDKCSVQYLKLTYWKIAFKSNKTEHDESNLQELQILLHVCHLVRQLSTKKIKTNNAEQYYYRTMLSYYIDQLPKEYVQVKKGATDLIRKFAKAKHSYFCNTCQRIIVSLTDFRMFICELEHKELRCPVTLGPLGMPCLVCSMCSTMANVSASKYIIF